MIIIDGSQLATAALSIAMAPTNKFNKPPFTKELGRHAILNSVRANIKRFKGEYAGNGGVVVAFDGHNVWRKDIFKFYKAHRQKARDESPLNWDILHDVMHTTREEMRNHFPFKTLFHEKVEADDIVGVLTKKAAAEGEPVVIVGSDKDYRQLLKYDDLGQPVKQWDIREKRFIGCNDPDMFLKELIICGDTSDGIPNILSADNCIVMGKRQSPMHTKKLDMFLNNPPSEYKEEHLRNFKRNEQLISFEYIPEEYDSLILELYSNTKANKRMDMVTYFMRNDLRDLMEKAGDF